MSAPRAPSGASDRYLLLPAIAGIIGPALFTILYMGQEAFRADEYSPAAETVSALQAGPNGWIQQINFVVLGLFTQAFAVGLHRGLRQIRAGILGPALLFISGISLLLAALFPLREDTAGVTYDPGGHLVASAACFLASALGLTVVSFRVARDPDWHGLATFTRVAGMLGLATFVAMGVLVIPEGAVFHDWAGVAQRAVILLVHFAPRVALATRMLRVARAPSNSPPHPTKL